MDLTILKIKVHEACLHSVQNKVEELKSALQQFQDAANEETKSSAGDKYETGRVMMHLEKEKAASQLNQVLKQQKVLHQINPGKRLKTIQLGSLIQTDKGYLSLSVSLGMIKVEGQSVICISPVAPLGQAMLHKESEAQVTFNKVDYKILDIA